MGALAILGEFLLNPHVRRLSGTIPGRSRNNDLENREPIGDRSKSDPHPGVYFSAYRTSNSVHSESEDASHMVTEVLEEIPYCSRGTSSGNHKKAHSTSHPQFRSEKNPATIEGDQILLILQHLASNSNSAKFNNSINKFSELPKSLKTTTPTFDGKSENLNCLKICPKQV